VAADIFTHAESAPHTVIDLSTRVDWDAPPTAARGMAPALPMFEGVCVRKSDALKTAKKVWISKEERVDMPSAPLHVDDKEAICRMGRVNVGWARIRMLCTDTDGKVHVPDAGAGAGAELPTVEFSAQIASPCVLEALEWARTSKTNRAYGTAGALFAEAGEHLRMSSLAPPGMTVCEQGLGLFVDGDLSLGGRETLAVVNCASAPFQQYENAQIMDRVLQKAHERGRQRARGPAAAAAAGAGGVAAGAGPGTHAAVAAAPAPAPPPASAAGRAPAAAPAAATVARPAPAPGKGTQVASAIPARGRAASPPILLPRAAAAAPPASATSRLSKGALAQQAAMEKMKKV
jgi:hypothetical protein